MKPTRRRVLQLAGAGVVGWTLGCGDNHLGDDAAAVLEPDLASFVVAVWTPRAARSAEVEVDGGDGPPIVATLALADGLGAMPITGLAPDTAYEVTITIDGARSRPHHVRTAPAPTDARPVRIAIVADIDPSPEFETDLLDAVIAEQPDLVLAIGDFPYTDNGPPAHSLAEYRARHVEVRRHPPVRRLLEACGLRAIYDDHEFVNDWDAAAATAEPERYAAALQSWDEFFPLATPGDIKYRRWRWGAGLECFLLDCRRFRSANSAPDDADKTMLGATQRAWLIEAVAASTATFKLILTSVPLDFGVGDDHWATYVTERDAIFAQLIGISGVLFVSGDQHWFAAHRHAHGIREMQIGPTARGVLAPGAMVPGVLYRAQRYNAGVIEIAGDTLTLSGLGEGGERFYRETVTAAELTPRATT